MFRKQLINYTLWLLFCFVGGILGAWLYDYSINRYINNFSASSAMSRYDQNSALIIRDAKKVVIEQNEKIADTISASESLLMGLFKKNNSGQYDLTKVEAQALVLTSDGWLITNQVSPDKEWYKNYVAIDKSGKIFNLDRSLDDASGLSFIHASGASGLVVADFMKAKDLQRGQTMLAVNWLAEARQDMITKIDASPNILKSSDQPYKQLLTAANYASGNYLAALDISGKVLGLFNNDGKLFATDYFVYKTSSLLAAKKNVIPVLGVNYYNLSWQAGSKLASQGALLAKSQQAPAVLKASPAEQAGLKEGDVILSLDNVVVSRDNDLADLLTDYRPQDKVIIKYLSGGKEKSVEITLGGK